MGPISIEASPHCYHSIKGHRHLTFIFCLVSLSLSLSKSFLNFVFFVFAFPFCLFCSTCFMMRFHREILHNLFVFARTSITLFHPFYFYSFVKFLLYVMQLCSSNFGIVVLLVVGII